MHIYYFATNASFLRVIANLREWTSLLFKSNTTSNKLQENGTVSQRSRHRSNRTQKAIPSAVAGHQFPQFGCIG